MSTAQVHYRALSESSQMSRRNSNSFRSSLDLKSDDTLFHDLDLKNALSRQPRLPRNYRCLRTSAVIGWIVSLALFLALVVSHSNLAPNVRPLDISRVGYRGAQPVPSIREGVKLQKGVPGAAASKGGGGEVAAYPDRAGGLQSKVTIVSGFYRIDSGKKHRVSEYHDWMTNFLRSVELPIIFYCAPELHEYIKSLRGNKPITIIDDYETPFSMPPLEDLGGRDWAVMQHKIDPEKHVHVPDVYGIWTAKPWIVKHAKDLNPYHSEYFFWVDAGGFRDPAVVHTFRGLSQALDNIYNTVPRDTLILAATTVPFEDGTEYVKAAVPGGDMDRGDRLQGGWYGGRKEGIDWWESETRRVTVRQAAMQKFTAKEQPVWTQAARLNWRKIYVQNMAYREGPDCGPDMWFGFEYFADGRECVVPAWNGPKYSSLDPPRIAVPPGLAGRD